MTFKLLALSLSALAVASSATAQSDSITKTDGEVVKDVKVTDFDVRSVRYKRRGNSESIETDRVATIKLEDFDDAFARGKNDPGVLVTQAKEQADAKNDVLAQLGYIAAAKKYFEFGNASEAVAALNAVQKAYPEGGVVPDVYRLKFEYYMGIGRKGASSAQKVATDYESAAIGGAWPNGFAVEASFFKVLSSEASPAEFQNKLRSVVNSARSANPMVANRANIELAHSLRKNGKPADAQRIYDDIIKKDNVDDSARAGAYLGMGLAEFENAGNDKDKAKKALLYFLRVRLETREAFPGQHAESLYHAIQAARTWQGPEYRYIMGRCRSILFADFPDSEWTKLAKQR